MAWIKTNFQGVWVFEPRVWNDQRGYFVETYNASGLPDELQDISFVQDNEAASVRGVLRGLHYQLPPHAQSKLVRVVQGEVLDVIVDLRKESSTFGQHLSVILNDIQKKQLFVPKGFAHGYVVLSPTAIFAYKCDAFYNFSAEAGIKYDDPVLGIDWLLPAEECLVSDKDRILPTFDQHTPFAL
ncbi:MAG: dTDP-4-dehydrorhamnose 3,5-epimerase [Saprospiraceae bacterium]|jgi:dTDP-4-dehydrorhamnose 3,5-epimerase|nr:dTDP-4-dehydrorhamnose 3,5-epimerase [Saprospiraceae bacterium]MBK9566699.1 dTDP-4-dehydrorhamnose 3,5-epimerase [Saprospiraceae bacterium]MBP6446829.1 dTDP-4-dehydrorhamnose 3,5-epimerase [Saprospiraceae bacterium]